MTSSSQDHINGILRLIAPELKADAKRKLKTVKGRQKWLHNLRHYVEMHPKFSHQPPSGQRDPEDLIKQLRKLGAGDSCYVVASDSDLDDTFQSLKEMVEQQFDLFGHGTILSCIPGKLALYRSAWPHHNLIIHRPRHL